MAEMFERLESRTLLSVSHGHDHAAGAHEPDVFWYVPPGEPEPVEQTPRFVPTEFKWSQPGGLGTPVSLTYGYSNLLNGVLPGGLTSAQLTAAVEEAMQVWTAVVPLRLTQQADPGLTPTDNPTFGNPAPTTPNFRWGHHSIDGASGANALAHAYFPGITGAGAGLSGDVHFDRDNAFTLIHGAGFDVHEVAVHEFGHSLGLNHEPTPANGGQNAIMNPVYAARYAGPGTAFLLTDDIAGMQSRYGAGFGYVLDSDGTLNLSGTEANNTFTLNVSGGNITATSAGFGSFTIPVGTVSGIVINGRGGADTFSIDASTIPVTLNGAAGDDAVTLGPAATALPAFRYIGGTGNDTLTVNGGGVTFAADAITDTANLTLNVNTDNAGAAAVTFATTQHLAGLNLGSGATVTLNASGSRYVHTKALSIAATAKLDLKDNDLIVDYEGGQPSPEFVLRDKVKQFRDGSPFGLAYTPGAGERVIAIAEKTEWGFPTFNGETLDNSTVIGKYTYFGDANLDGKVDSNDYVAVDVGLGNGNSWVQGDFNFSGTVTSDDYVAIDTNLGRGVTIGDPLATAEPFTAEMVALTTTSEQTTLVIDDVATRATKTRSKLSSATRKVAGPR